MYAFVIGMAMFQPKNITKGIHNEEGSSSNLHAWLRALKGTPDKQLVCQASVDRYIYMKYALVHLVSHAI